jgi:hypothetical protein
MDTSKFVGLRDRAILAILIYTTSRAGAVAKLRRGSFLLLPVHSGKQRLSRFAVQPQAGTPP